MPFIADAAFDAALDYCRTNGTNLHICSSEPATYGAIAAAELATYGSITIGANKNAATSGREAEIPELTSGGGVTVDTTGTATHWALSNGTDTLVATGELTASQALTSGNPLTHPAFALRIRDAVTPA